MATTITVQVTDSLGAVATATASADISAGLIPADRITTWKPGQTHNGGIPNRTTIYKTISPAGAGKDDTANLQAALDACPAGQVVQLTAGIFNITGGGLWLRTSNVTLCGAGAGNGGVFGTIDSSGNYTCQFLPQGTGTFLNKMDRTTNGTLLLSIGPNFTPAGSFNASANLTADAVKESKSCIIQGNPGLAVGVPVLIDILTDNDPDAFWGEKHDPAGATFIADTGGKASTTVTVSNISGTLNPAMGPTFTYPTAGTNGQTWITAQKSGTTGGNGVYTLNQPATFSNQKVYAGNGSRRWFSRQDRSFCQLMKVTSFSDNGDGTFTVNFETPFHINFPVAYWAQLTTFSTPWVSNSGVESLYMFGGRNGDGGGNLYVAMADNCWATNVESHYSQGSGINVNMSYRFDLTGSYMHESPNPNPGGDGYNCSINFGTSDSLIENNIMINGNKNIVVRGAGGGNVAAYNYMEDPFGSQYPMSPEAGVNAGHFCGTHMMLLEGNWSNNYKGDNFWGASAWITVHRNYLTGKRRGYGPLANYVSVQGSCSYPYGDFSGRIMVDVQAGSYYTNFTGNVMGQQGQVLLSSPNPCYDLVETGWLYENLSDFLQGNVVPMWNMGTDQSHQGVDGNNTWVPNTYQTQLRMGNWDWFTQTQNWHGIGGTSQTAQVAPQPIPDSYYLTAKPAFFGSNQWPWVDPSTGTTYVLPAKQRFDAGTPNQVT